MKASELRIGNLIVAECRVLTVNEIKETSDEGHETINGWEEEEITGIPLTEEWLLKLGFKYDDEIYSFGLLSINKHRAGIDGRERFLINIPGFTPSFEHVHQLQNLYFALTGEELIIQK